jgi:hypothetical protein
MLHTIEAKHVSEWVLLLMHTFFAVQPPVKKEPKIRRLSRLLVRTTLVTLPASHYQMLRN